MIVHKNNITQTDDPQVPCELFRNCSYDPRVVISKVTWRTFQAKLEIIKKSTPKKFLIFEEMELSDSKIKNFRHTGKVGPSTLRWDRKVGP